MARQLINLVVDNKPPICLNMTELFYGPDIDGRTERGREEREAKAKNYCTRCPYRGRCLERTLVLENKSPSFGIHGVAGGMTSSERTRFYVHLREEGYAEVPMGGELFATLQAFTRSEIARKRRAS